MPQCLQTLGVVLLINRLREKITSHALEVACLITSLEVTLPLTDWSLRDLQNLDVIALDWLNLKRLIDVTAPDWRNLQTSLPFKGRQDWKNNLFNTPWSLWTTCPLGYSDCKATNCLHLTESLGQHAPWYHQFSWASQLLIQTEYSSLSSLTRLSFFTDVHCVNSLDVEQMFCIQKNVYYENDNSNATLM